MSEPVSGGRTAPPTGLNPPRRAAGPDGSELDLEELAAEVCERYHAIYTDEQERYGDAGRLWCRHDNQHLLNWAAEAAEGLVDLDREVAWLARVLESRGFPLDRLAHNLDLDADVVRDRVPGCELMATALNMAAVMVRERGTFLD
jgi:hypothetical protein